MKPAHCLLLVLCTLPACDKVREALKQPAKPVVPSTRSEVQAAAPAASGQLVNDITAADFESFTRQPGKLAIVDFHAHWCGPCRQLAPILEKIAAEHHGHVLIGKINVDQNREFAAAQGVNGIPDVRIFRDGSQVDRFVGLPPEQEVRKRIADHATGLSPTPADAAGQPNKPAEPTIQPMSKDWLPPGMQRR
jgi:thioredoxin